MSEFSEIMINPKATLEHLNNMSEGNMVSHLGIEYTEIGENYLCGKMPVDNRTTQPLGMLHGGASVVLAESLGSVAANMCLDNEKQYAVGLDINANHIRGVRGGTEFVFGKATAIHVGSQTQIWQIDITNEKGKMVCVSRLTMAVLNK